jgi:hypothetical protein
MGFENAQVIGFLQSDRGMLQKAMIQTISVKFLFGY